MRPLKSQKIFFFIGLLSLLATKPTSSFAQNQSICPADISAESLGHGIAARDNASGTGWVLWSEQSVQSRFVPSPHPQNADHFLAVQYTNGQWLFDNNFSLTPFTPAPSDCLIAELDFDTDTVSILDSSVPAVHSIDAGIDNPGLSITPNTWKGLPNSGEFGLSADANNPSVTVVNIGQGTVDYDRNAGPRSVRINIDSLAAADHTVTVVWDNNDANVRFRVFNSDGSNISPTIQGSNPGTWTGALDANTPHYMNLWSTSGIANYTVTIEANVPVSIENQPSDLIITEGARADFVVDAIGSGTLGYQWFANGTLLPGETDSTLTIFNSSISENGTNYTVRVSNGTGAVTSNAATLTVNPIVSLGLFSQEADTSTWILDGPAFTLDYTVATNTDPEGWGNALLRIDNLLLVGGDFVGIKRRRSDLLTNRPFLAALDAVTGQPVSSFQIPFEVDGVVRSLVLSPDGQTVYVGGDFGLLALNSSTGHLEYSIEVSDGNNPGRVFDISVTNTEMYIGGDFSHVEGEFRANIAKLSLDGEVDDSWTPRVSNGFSAGRSAPVQSITASPDGSKVYIGGNFQEVDGIPVELSTGDGRISMFALSALDGSVQPERFSANVGGNSKGLTAHDIAVTDDYVIIAWGGPNYLTFHALDGTRLRQYSGKGDVQALQVVGNHVFVGHHGEFFNFLPNPIPQEALVSSNPNVIEPYKLHSFRIDDGGSFEFEQAWRLDGPFGVWAIAAAEDSIWIAGEIITAGTNDRRVEGIARFPALQ